MNEKDAFLQSGLVQEYVLGLCNAANKAKVESMAEKYPDVAELIGQSRMAMRQYCRSSRKKSLVESEHHTIPLEHDPGNNVIRTMPIKGHHPKGRLTATFALSLTILAIFVAGITIAKNKQLKKELMASKSVNDEMISRMNGLMSTHKSLQSHFILLQDLNTNQMRLNDWSDKASARAVVYWNQVKQKALMQLVNLPSPPRNMTYQLWADVNGEMKDMGVLSLDKDWLPIPFLQHIEALNITLEKRGGNNRPTLDKLVCSTSIN